MKITQYFQDGIGLIPVELLWETLNEGERGLVYLMFEHGRLHCKGRTLVIDGNPYGSDFGEVFTISVETWRDADTDTRRIWSTWDLMKEKRIKLDLRGPHTDDITVEIEVINSELLREFVGYDGSNISTDLYDEKFFKSTQTKMGAKVWAQAAAALAIGDVDPTGRKLATYLLEQDIWPQGKLSEDLLRRHLSPLITEFKRRT